MQIFCPHCGQQVLAEDINLKQVLAKCRACHGVFSFAGAAEEAGTAARMEPRRRTERAATPLPASIKVEDWGGNLRFVRRWFTWSVAFLIPFCIAWDAFLFFWYFVLGSKEGPEGAFAAIFWVFPIGHVAIGFGITYLTLCLLLNRTIIEVGSELRIRHEPLPWSGNRVLSSADLKQLYCREKIRHGRQGRAWSRYELYAITRDGRKIKLLSGLEDVDQALYLEEQIEKRLGIADRHVRGEVEK